MYLPSQFEVSDKSAIFAFIKANAFGQLISTVQGKLFCSHIPFLLGDNGAVLVGHVAKRNPQWESIQAQEILVTFQGPHDYISPSWYSTPSVPTWNYQAVHVYGNAHIIAEKEALRGIVNALTKTYESAFEAPWKPEYKDSLLDAIIGIEIEITDLQCKYKISQNRPEIDQREIAKQLHQRGSLPLSKAMKKV